MFGEGGRALPSEGGGGGQNVHLRLSIRHFTGEFFIVTQSIPKRTAQQGFGKGGSTPQPTKLRTPPGDIEKFANQCARVRAVSPCFTPAHSNSHPRQFNGASVNSLGRV